MANANYTAEEIDQAFEEDAPDHTCASAGGRDACPGCELEDAEHGWGDFSYSSPGDTTEIMLRGEEIRVTYIDGEAGGEGSGENIWMVVKVGRQYFRKEGYYASYDGSNWDRGVKEVKRKQRTVTFYE